MRSRCGDRAMTCGRRVAGRERRRRATRTRHTRFGAAAAAALIVAGGATPVAGQATPDTALRREQLADGVWLFRAPSALDVWTATNTVVVVNDDDVTVFDSNGRPGTARRVIAEIRRLTPLPVRTLVNSHWHLDHWTGNDEYARAFPGLRIIATTTTRDYMRRMGSRYFAEGVPKVPEAAALRADLEATPRVLPNVAFRDTLVLWSGRREFRLISVTGDATGSAVMYLPAERILVMGDVLASPEDGNGPPPWTTNSYAITPWLNSLRGLLALDATVVVPGQGPAFRDKAYLALTAELFAAIVSQVDAALSRGLVSLAEVQVVVNVDEIGRRYSPGASEPAPRFRTLVTTLVRKAHQEALDGVIRQ